MTSLPLRTEIAGGGGGHGAAAGRPSPRRNRCALRLAVGWVRVRSAGLLRPARPGRAVAALGAGVGLVARGAWGCCAPPVPAAESLRSPPDDK